ncbi:hypothetical protein PS2_031854 [Malus domestica]
MRQHDIEQLTSQLGELQMNWGDHVEEINVKSRLLDQFLEQEESVWKQRRRQNQVLKLKTEDGRWKKRPKRVKQLVDEYFIHLFTFMGNKS